MVDDWTFPSVFAAGARVHGDAPALIHGDRRISWSQLDARSRRLAGALAAAGVEPGDAVSLYLPNRPEYIEAFTAALAGGFVPFNTNYRYVAQELAYLWQDAPARAVVFDAAFRDRVDELRDRMPGVRVWLEVGDNDSPYEQAIAEADIAPRRDSTVGPDLLLYTGGTTGLPKGVAWRQGDLLTLLATAGRRCLPDRATSAQIEGRLGELGPGPAMLVACPLMHGTGLFHGLGAMAAGSPVVTLDSSRLDVPLLLDTIAQERVGSLVIVGDPFARPIAEHLDCEPDRWDLSTLRLVFSSGAMWSQEVKARLLAHAPKCRLVDGLGSSEATSIASSVSTADQVDQTATFFPNESTAIIHEDDTLAHPGDGRVGLLAVSGPIPLGYHNDPEKTATVFRTVAGRRWSVPGDFAVLESDGRIRLLGRGSSSINTAGEKVFPEEVEEVLKQHPAIADAAVVGVADERFGQAIVALVEPAGEIDEGDVQAHARRHLAGYKAPKLIHAVASLDRAANGKLDHRRLAVVAAEAWADRHA